MATLQSSYGNRMPAYLLGMIVNQELHNSTSRITEDVVGFGRAMFAGASDQTVTDTPSGLFEGITIRDVTVEGETADQFAEGATVPLCRMGVIAVDGSKAVNKGDEVYVTSTGLFTDVATGNQKIEGATFDATITAAGLVPVRLA